MLPSGMLEDGLGGSSSASEHSRTSVSKAKLASSGNFSNAKMLDRANERMPNMKK